MTLTALMTSTDVFDVDTDGALASSPSATFLKKGIAREAERP